MKFQVLSFEFHRFFFFGLLNENLAYFVVLKTAHTDMYGFFIPVEIFGLSKKRIFTRSHVATLLTTYQLVCQSDPSYEQFT